MARVALTDLVPWFKSKLAGAMKPILKEWARLRKDAEKAIKDVREACERIRNEGEKCLADKDRRKHRAGRAAIRFHKKVSGLISTIDVPEELSREAIEGLQKDLARLYNAIGGEWGGLLAQMDPYMIMARRKLRGAWRKVGDVVRGLGSLLGMCEPLELEGEVASLASRLEKLISDLRAIEAELGAISLKEEEVRKKLEELREAKEAIEASDVMRKLREAEEALENLSIELRTELRHAWKALLKLRSSSEAGAVSLGPGEAALLNAYLSDPVSALASEEEGYPGLKALLRKVEECLNRGIITLKPSKVEKLERWLKEAFSGSLLGLQGRSRKAVETIRAIRESEEARNMIEELRSLEEEISGLEKELEMLEGRERSLKAKLERLRAKIEDERRSLEGLVEKAIGEEVEIAIELP